MLSADEVQIQQQYQRLSRAFTASFLTQCTHFFLHTTVGSVYRAICRQQLAYGSKTRFIHTRIQISEVFRWKLEITVSPAEVCLILLPVNKNDKKSTVRRQPPIRTVSGQIIPKLRYLYHNWSISLVSQLLMSLYAVFTVK